MATTIYVELRKLKGSLVIALALISPTLVSILLTVVFLRQPAMGWKEMAMGTTGLWAYFVMPMTVTALCILVAQIEHGPRTWDHILSLPISRWRLFAAKAVIVMFLVAVMSAILCIEMRLVALFVEWVIPAKLPRGEFPWGLTALYLAEMWGAGLFMTMIELWVALAFRSFVAPLVVGLSGTFFAVAAFGAKETVFLPWVMPVSIIARDGSSAPLALTLGIGGGIVTCLLMMLHLSRREI